jgi:hypothetical protein
MLLLKWCKYLNDIRLGIKKISKEFLILHTFIMRVPLHLGPYTKHIHVQFIWIQPHCYNKNLSVNTQDEQHFTSINQPCIYQCTCVRMHPHPRTHARARTHTHTHTHTHTRIRKLPVCETSSLMIVSIRTRTSTVTLEHVYFCCLQLAGRDLRRGRDHLMWVLLQFISGSIQRNPVSYLCGHTSD